MRSPMLVVAGAKDVQCDPANLQSILEVIAAPVESHVVPNLSHVLRFDEREPSIFKYPKLIESRLKERSWRRSRDGWLGRLRCESDSNSGAACWR
jgi:fermentation-respiration switch protein FrsA (DUF1100 family)